MHFANSIQFIIRHRIAFVALMALGMLAGLAQTVLHLKVDNSLSIWFLDNNPDYQEYLQFQTTQGSDQIVVALVPTKDAFDSTYVSRLLDLHEALDSLPYVNATMSLANIQYPVYVGRKLRYRPLYRTNRSQESMRKVLEDLPALQRQLISEDGKYCFFYAQLAPTSVIEEDRKGYVEHIVQTIEEKVEKPIISGQPILNEAFSQSIYWESIVFAVLTVAVILILLVFMLPNVYYLPMAFLAVVIPVSITLGIMTGLGYAMNLISMVMPTILMVYSISDTIHIVNIFHQHRRTHPHQEPVEQIKAALTKSLKPCFYTTITTVIGYLALYLSPLPAFQIMGFFTFLGLIMAFLLVYVITAIGFYYLPVGADLRVRPIVRKINIDWLVLWVKQTTSNRKETILTLGIAIFLAGILGMSFVEVNTDFLNLLGKGKALEDLHLLEDKLGGNARLQMNVSRKDGGSILNQVELDRLAIFQTKLDSNAFLKHSLSLVNFQAFLEARTALMPGIQSLDFEQIIRESDPSPNTFFSFFSDDFKQLALNANIKELGTKDMEGLLVDIEAAFEDVYAQDDYDLKIHGFTALYAQFNYYILQTQFRSFGMAFLFAFGILFFFIGHFKTSILALIPNLLPLAMAVLVMLLLGIHLEAATAMLAPIMLGVAMDDTIHLMHQFKRRRKEGLSVEKSMDEAISYTGPALFSTTLSLLCGFLVVAMSGVPSVSIFGMLCAFTIVAALLADLIFLPALMKRFL